ncbi:MAG: flavodoxin family protein [Deltaproteobacteria bacterium]|nr:flavodoxin family protein [Deltaproteobacteria bacterium]
MKKVLAINASPRKSWNTALVLEKALAGAAEAGAETKLVHLHGMKFTGCVSCFACKRIEKNAALCVVNDDLRPLLEECMTADALIVGCPIYFGNLNAYAIAFLERLLFAGYTYNMETPSKFPRQIVSALVCTMNATEEQMRQHGYEALMERYAMTMKTILRGPAEWLAVTDTLQYTDYGKYMSSIFDPEHKARMRAEKFPQDLEAARQLGMRLIRV